MTAIIERGIGELMKAKNESSGIRRQVESSRSRLPAAVSVLVVAELLFAIAPSVRAQTPDPADIADGARLFRQKGNCQACHGWAGDGRKMDSQMPDSANLRETSPDRQNLIVTIKCGRPGKDMPAFDKFAYSDGRCYGLKQADLKSRQLNMADPPATLTLREIEAVVDFLLVKIVGQGVMSHAKCVEFWGSDVESCNEFPK